MNFISQGQKFVNSENRIEMAKQAAAALEIDRVMVALDGPEELTKWDINLITKAANMARY